MPDTPDLLPKSRAYFRKFLVTHRQQISDAVREFRVGAGTGYSYFYRSDQLIQCLRNIHHNLDETFGNLTIPEEFTSPNQLVKTWKWFYDYLIKEEDLIKEIREKIIHDAKEEYGARFDEYMKAGMIFPLPFSGIAQIHSEVKDVLNYILNMHELKEFIDKEKNTQDTEKKVEKVDEGELQSKMSNNSIFDIAIITAIYEPELRRVKEIIANPQRLIIQDDPTIYTTGTITKSDGKIITVVIASDDKMGMPAAATLATKSIFNFNPKYLVMLGICAGIKGKVNEGDIIITEFAWDYGSGKHEKIKNWLGITKEIFKPYINQIQLDVHLETLFKNIVSQKKYLSQIQSNWNSNKPKFNNSLNSFIGPFASGSAVIANEDIVSNINSNHGKLLGFDMEAYAIFNSARFTPSIKTKSIVIKSASDFGDSNKNHPNKDILQDYAAYTSAQYFLQIAINDLTY